MPTAPPTQVPTEMPTSSPTEPVSDFHRKDRTGYKDGSKTLPFDYNMPTNWVTKGCDFAVILS